MACPNLKSPAVLKDFNNLVERLGGKPLSSTHIEDRDFYKQSLSPDQEEAYYRAYHYWNEHRGNVKNIGKYLDKAEGKEAEKAPAFSITDPDVKPGAKPEPVTSVEKIASFLGNTADKIKYGISPISAGKIAKMAARDIRELGGKLARHKDQLNEALRDTRRYFERLSPEDQLAFQITMERGEKHLNIDGTENVAHNQIASILRTMQDDKRDEVRAMGEGHLEHFYENYFPHIWQDSNAAFAFFSARSPFKGKQAFLKKRDIGSIAEGVYEHHLAPVSYNPVDMVLLKMNEMDKYLLAHKTIQMWKNTIVDKATGMTMVKYIPFHGEKPDGYVRPADAFATVWGKPSLKIHEYHDSAIMEPLYAIAHALGIATDRKPTLPIRALGYSVSGEPLPEKFEFDPNNPENFAPSNAGKTGPGKVVTKFGTPEGVLAHEIGHQIDDMYDLQGQMLSDKVIRKELRDLTAATMGPKKWQGQGGEKMATMMYGLIHAPEAFKQIAPHAYREFTDILRKDEKLKPILDIKPSLKIPEHNTAEAYVGGGLIRGYNYMHPEAAKILNNYLSPGLRGNVFYDLYRTAGNRLNQYQLGLSAFHAGFTALDATISKFALGVYKITHGDTGAGLKDIAISAIPGVAAVQNVIRGDALQKAWLGTSTDPLMMKIAEWMAVAGGRAKQDEVYSLEAAKNMKRAFQERSVLGNIKGGMLFSDYVLDKISSPIMEQLVPRQKMGVFSDMMKYYLEKHPNLDYEQARIFAQKAWDSVDNRLGQVVYDNLFWNRIVKDMAMASVRSLGWNLGTIREIGGGAADLIPLIQRGIKSLNDPEFRRMMKNNPDAAEFTLRTSYIAGLAAIPALWGAIYQILHTGQAPEDIKDLYFPRNGEYDEDGNPKRMNTPSYIKDLADYWDDIPRTLKSKFSPINNAVTYLIQNEDYNRNQIYNQDNDPQQIMLDLLGYAGQQLEPFGVRNMIKSIQDKGGFTAPALEPFVGFTPAPRSVMMSATQKRAQDMAGKNVPIGGTPTDKVEKRQRVTELEKQYVASGNNPAYMNEQDEDRKKELETLRRKPLIEAMKEGKINERDMTEIINRSGKSSLQRTLRSLSVYQIRVLLKTASPKEKIEIAKVLDKRRAVENEDADDYMSRWWNVPEGPDQDSQRADIEQKAQDFFDNKLAGYDDALPDGDEKTSLKKQSESARKHFESGIGKVIKRESDISSAEEDINGRH
jgi:hypothetical protein